EIILIASLLSGWSSRSLHDALPIFGGGDLLGLHCIAQRCLIGSIGQFRHRNVSCSSWTTALWSRFYVHFTSKSGTPRIYERSPRSEEHTSELQSRFDIVCRLMLIQA